jgi:hypothetical protein
MSAFQTQYHGDKKIDSILANIYRILNWLNDKIKVDIKRSETTLTNNITNNILPLIHDPVTVVDTTSVDLTLNDQEISAETIGLTGTITFVE